jgi:hypothetical protein
MRHSQWLSHLALAPQQLSFNNLHERMLSQARAIDPALKMTDKETQRLHESERIDSGRSGGQGRSGQGFGRGRGRGRGSGAACVPPEKQAAMSVKKQAEHHKPLASQEMPSSQQGEHRNLDLTREGANLTAQEQPFVDRVPTNVMSVLTTPAAPAPAGSVIRDVLSANAKKKQTESVTPSDGRAFTREVNNVNFKCQARNCETMLAASSPVDGGANGGLTGSNMSRIEMTFAEADVPGVADNDLKDLGVGAFAALGHSRGQSVAGEPSQVCV